MTTLTKSQAIALLGDYAFVSGTAREIPARINALIEFSKEHVNVTVEANNSWSTPPKARTAKACKRLGGTTYAYQVWAVAR